MKRKFSVIFTALLLLSVLTFSIQAFAEDAQTTEEICVVVSTQFFGSNKTLNSDDIVIMWRSSGSIETVKLADIGLEEFIGKSDDLFRLQIAMVSDGSAKTATLKGSFTDCLAVTYSSDLRSFVLDGVTYTAENAPPIFNQNGSATNVFDTADKLSYWFIDTVSSAHMTRVMDVDGDGDADAFYIGVKSAYKVEYIEEGNVYFKSIEGYEEMLAKEEVFSEPLKKDDVFVASILGSTLYAEKVEPVETYAVKLSTSNGYVTFANGIEAKYDDLTIAGTSGVNFNNSMLGENALYNYYIYNGELIYADKVTPKYNFAVLRDVEYVDNVLDPSTMEEHPVFVANIITEEDGELVTKQLTLSGRSVIGGVWYTAEELYDMYRYGENWDGKIEYIYLLIADYKQNKDGGWSLVICQDYDPQAYLVLPAGNNISYNKSTGYYTIDGIDKVVIDDTTAVYYKYQKPNTPSGSFRFLGKYAPEDIPQKPFDAFACSETYLRYNEEDDTYTLLATVLEDKIVCFEEVSYYGNDGRLIVYADKEPWIEYVDGEVYNCYSFKNIVTGEKTELKIVNNAFPVYCGGVYGYDPAAEYYNEINRSQAVTYPTIQWDNIISISESDNTIQLSSGRSIKITDDVVVWGGTKACGGRKELTVAELSSQHKMLEAAGLDGAEVILIYYKNEDGEMILACVVAEYYQLDGSGKPFAYRPFGNDSKHSYGQWTEVSGNCADGGYKYKICSVCGDKETIFLTPSKDHSFGEWIVDKEPTTAEKGSRHRECSVCGTTETESIPVIEAKVEAVISLSSTEAKPGESFKITLSLKTDTTINSIAIKGFEYDKDVLEFVGFGDYSAIEDMPIFASVFDDEKEYILIGFTEGVMFDGDVCTLEFKVKENATDTVTEIKATPILKLDSKEIFSEMKGEGITIYTYVKGDIDGDRDVDIDDAVYLFGYSIVPEFYPVTYLGEMDLDHDGDVDIQDAIKLFNYSMLPDLYPLG